jgi:hypothetical protein
MDNFLSFRGRLARLSYDNSKFKADLVFRRLVQAVKAGFDPDQARDEDGRWSSEGTTDIFKSENSDQGLIAEFVERARQLKVAGKTSNAMSRCVDLCLPLLMRPSLGTDRNEWSFRRCLNACLGKMGA